MSDDYIAQLRTQMDLARAEYEQHIAEFAKKNIELRNELTDARRLLANQDHAWKELSAINANLLTELNTFRDGLAMEVQTASVAKKAFAALDLLRSLRQDYQHHDCASDRCAACDIDAVLEAP